MKKIKSSTLKLFVDFILGAILGLFFAKLFPDGVTDLRWWIGMFAALSVLNTYIYLMEKLTKREVEEGNEY